MIKYSIRKMGNKNISLNSCKASTSVFSGKIGIYKGNIIKISEWSLYKDRKGFTVLNHFGIKTEIDGYTMYAFFTSKLNFYQGNGVFNRLNNHKCEEGIFSYVNYPICSKSDDFNQYVYCSYDLSDHPLYIQRAYEQGIDVKMCAFHNYKQAYYNAVYFNKIYIHGEIKSEVFENDIMIASSLGILNKHNSALFLNNRIKLLDLKRANEGLISSMYPFND